jgi:hypothetical protein
MSQEPPGPGSSYAPPPAFQPPPGTYQPPGSPAPAMPMAYAAGGVAGIMSQFRGRALWSCVVGLVTIIAPFVVHYIFYVLALVGLYYGVLAIRRGQIIGGVVGIVLNVIGGLLTLLLLYGPHS